MINYIFNYYLFFNILWANYIYENYEFMGEKLNLRELFIETFFT
jgi:hypothetical protein